MCVRRAYFGCKYIWWGIWKGDEGGDLTDYQGVRIGGSEGYSFAAQTAHKCSPYNAPYGEKRRSVWHKNGGSFALKRQGKRIVSQGVLHREPKLA